MEETAPLKIYLNGLATREANVYRHSWSEGDLVMIDQRTTMHMVMSDYDIAKMHRVMQRTTITDVGDAPGCTGAPRPVGVTGLTGARDRAAVPHAAACYAAAAAAAAAAFHSRLLTLLRSLRVLRLFVRTSCHATYWRYHWYM